MQIYATNALAYLIGKIKLVYSIESIGWMCICGKTNKRRRRFSFIKDKSFNEGN